MALNIYSLIFIVLNSFCPERWVEVEVLEVQAESTVQGLRVLFEGPGFSRALEV